MVKILLQTCSPSTSISPSSSAQRIPIVAGASLLEPTEPTGERCSRKSVQHRSLLRRQSNVRSRSLQRFHTSDRPRPFTPSSGNRPGRNDRRGTRQRSVDSNHPRPLKSQARAPPLSHPPHPHIAGFYSTTCPNISFHCL